MSSLLTQLRVGALDLPNRVVMAPLTRCRSGEDRIPNRLMSEYYAQRAGAGLIISEATSVSRSAIGYPRTPGIWSEQQVEGWRTVTRAVHMAGGRIFQQLWHTGRLSHGVYLDGQKPVAPSAVRPSGHPHLLRPKRAYPTPRALATIEIPTIIDEFQRAAKNAMAAGFDGVEIHAANGYLVDQFLQDSTNTRADEYGGSVENRARFLLEVIDGAISVWGPDRVGVHLAPRCDQQSMGDSDPQATFTHVAKELDRRRIAFICAREYEAHDSVAPSIRQAFGGIFIANERFTIASADAAVSRGSADAVAFGELFITNPDLPLRIAHNSSLNPLAPTSMYYHFGAEGYTDFPMMDPGEI